MTTNFSVADMRRIMGLSFNAVLPTDSAARMLLEEVCEAAIEPEEDEDEHGQCITVWATPERVVELCLDELTNQEMWQVFVELELYTNVELPVTGPQGDSLTDWVYSRLCEPLLLLVKGAQDDEEDGMRAEELRQEYLEAEGATDETPMGEEMGE